MQSDSTITAKVTVNGFIIEESTAAVKIVNGELNIEEELLFWFLQKKLDAAVVSLLNVWVCACV
jgi:hypothetical protein